MSDVTIALLITVSTFAFLVLWVPFLILMDWRLKAFIVRRRSCQAGQHRQAILLGRR
jgi:hypothetical protein